MRKGGLGEKSDIRTEACIHVGLQLSGSPMSSGFDEQAFNLSNSKLGHNVVLVWLSLDQLINEVQEFALILLHQMNKTAKCSMATK